MILAVLDVTPNPVASAGTTYPVYSSPALKSVILNEENEPGRARVVHPLLEPTCL